jgi:hypothetical protein
VLVATQLYQQLLSGCLVQFLLVWVLHWTSQSRIVDFTWLLLLSAMMVRIILLFEFAEPLFSAPTITKVGITNTSLQIFGTNYNSVRTSFTGCCFIDQIV